ncbi:2-hydroxy-3-oxopropionate reductase [Gephyromycinifex aptenodytis]|uniref:2-hydroxy-3-oxopropionate reductase n=1 Tax=Gephyromycinifex aptenodytis TaxID=2716227 RepID=UPI001445F69E|nr:2-hydroxy-3-oxopropionate reductase [Gephyromycinifex aptenodytis]
MKVGFIGLGIMGKPMAKNLLNAGHELVVLDRSDASAELTELGASSASSAAEMAAQVELVITMVPDSPQVREVALGADGLIEGAREGLVYVDMSSISPITSREVAAALAAKGVKMLDAPVSGGEPKAIDGTLAVMVGGDEQTLAKVEGVLDVMAGSVTYVGPIGAGNIAKLANQVVVALNIAAVAEAFTLAQKAGVDPAMVLAAIRGGLAGSAVLDAKGPMMLDGNITPGFRINLHIKDLNNALATSHEVGVPLPLTAAVREMMTALAVDGYDTSDHSALVRHYEKLANTQVRRDETIS